MAVKQAAHMGMCSRTMAGPTVSTKSTVGKDRDLLVAQIAVVGGLLPVNAQLNPALVGQFDSNVGLRPLP